MAFAPSKARRLKTRKEATVSLNSMMDMMTIILLFLLKSMSASGALLQATITNLPESIVDRQPEVHLHILVDQNGISQKTEESAQAARKMIVTAEDMQDSTEVSIPMLEDYLNEKRAFDERLGKTEIAHILTVEAADNIQYSWILKIINTATMVGFDTFDFVVYKVEKST